MYQSLQVVTPPATEPVAVADARAHCRIDTTFDDTYLGGLVTAARMLVEEHLARCLITQSLLWSVADAPMTGAPYPGMPAPLQVLPLAFTWLTLQRRSIELPRSPVQSVDGVQQVAGDGTVSPVAAGAVNALLGSNPARLRINAAPPSGGGFVVRFTAGYGTTADTVPRPIVQALLMLTAWLYENRGDAGGDWPVVVERLLAPYRIVTFGG